MGSLAAILKHVPIFPNPQESLYTDLKYDMCRTLNSIANALHSPRPRAEALSDDTVLQDGWVYKCEFAPGFQPEFLSHETLMKSVHHRTAPPTTAFKDAAVDISASLPSASSPPTSHLDADHSSNDTISKSAITFAEARDAFPAGGHLSHWYREELVPELRSGGHYVIYLVQGDSFSHYSSY
jgi:hypothetical protein